VALRGFAFYGVAAEGKEKKKIKVKRKEKKTKKQ
jgi:hypothetical protein